jgi:hypothetical protein
VDVPGHVVERGVLEAPASIENDGLATAREAEMEKGQTMAPTLAITSDYNEPGYGQSKLLDTWRVNSR